MEGFTKVERDALEQQRIALKQIREARRAKRPKPKPTRWQRVKGVFTRKIW